MGKSLMTADEMEKAMKPNNRIYKAESDELKAAALSSDIGNRIKALNSVIEVGRVDLWNYEQVRERTFQYLSACMATASYPTVMGLASLAYGYSTQGLNQFLRKHPDSPTAEFVETVKTIFADILTNQGLMRNADTTQVIFQLKNQNNFQDKIVVEPAPEKSPLDQIDAEALQRRIEATVVLDD